VRRGTRRNIIPAGPADHGRWTTFRRAAGICAAGDHNTDVLGLFLDKSLLEVARHSINVNCICPGPTDTPMLRSRPEKLKEAFLRAIPFHRFAKPQKIADAILFFASPRSG
jgi:hypothetical protein